MNRSLILAAAVAIPLLVGSLASSQDLVQELVTGCEQELTSYCSQVTPGEGRVLACLYAHGDKLSGRCEYAVYDTAAQLERAVAALSYVANECDDDLAEHCAAVETGEGRLLQCLEKNEISKRCKDALADVARR